MPKIVKLSDLNKKEKEKILQQTKKEVEERKAKIESEISFTSKNKSANTKVNLPINTSSNMSNKATKLPTRSWAEPNNTNIKVNIKDIANTVLKNQKEKEEKNKFINRSGISTIGSNLGHIVKSTGAGMVSGTAGIVQGLLTDTADQLNKGREKDVKETSKDLTKSLLNLISPGSNINAIKDGVVEGAKSILPIIMNKDKSTLEKGTEVVMNAVSNAKNTNSIGRFVNSAMQQYGSIDKNAGDNVLQINKKISEPIAKMNQDIAEERENYGGVTKFLGSTGQVVGNMAPSIVTSAITKKPAISLATMGLSVKGQATQEALNKGATLDEAVKIGDTKAMIEVGTEMLTGGVNIFGKGALDDIIEKGIDKKVKNEVANYLLKKGIDIPGEILEETVSDILNTAIDKGTVDPNAEYSLKDWGETSLVTTLSTIVLNGISGGYSRQSYINNSQNLQQNSKINLPTQQITQKQNKMAQNQNMEQINGIQSTTDLNLPMQKYQYQKSDNIKVDNLRQDASKYFNNSIKTQNYIKMLEQIIEDKDIDIRLDSNLTTVDGKIANGSYSNGIITINPNSTRAGEFVAIHELTHAIGTKQMKNMINSYRQSNLEFNSAVEELLKNYNTTEINEEALSDVSAKLFGNQEFINNLAQNNPNLFQKIYNEIKYLWHQFTGYKNQDQFINDLRYKWEQAYRNNQININNQTQYSIAGRNAMNNAIMADSNNIIIEQSYNKALQMANNSIDNETIRKTTNWFQDKNGDWKFEFSDKDMSLKNIKLKKGNIYKLGDILEHDTLFILYPQLKDYNVTFKDLNRGNGSFNKRTKNININSNMIGKKVSIQGTLIHEIQHAIQNIEGFERGGSSKGSKLAYYNKLGEIEADNTKQRYLAERKGDLNRYNIAPESSKANPKHSRLDNYLKNRNIIDKMKDSMYNYFNNKNSREVNYEEDYTDYQEENLKNNREDRRLVVDRRNLSSDNKGRNLSEQQQKYFKDSIVRDENGNLKTMYHGTDADFNISTYENYGKTGTAYGKGFYFTDSKESAYSYGKNLKEVYLDIKKPMEIGKTTMSNAEFRKLAEVINEETNGTIEADYGSIEDVLMDYDYGGDDIDLTNSLMSVSGLSTDKFYKILKDTLGYDGIKANNKTNGKDGNYYLAFNSNQIKNVDNINPTDNEDIRYSQNNVNWQSYLDKNFETTGTRTNLKDIKLPMRKETKSKKVNLPTESDIYKINNKEKVELLTDEDYEVLNKIYEKEGKTEVLTEKKKAKLLDKYASDKYKLKDSIDILAQKVVNKGHYVDKLSEKTKNPELKFIYDKNLNSFAEGQYSIGVAQTDNSGKIIGKSINDIWKPVEENNLSKEFSEYLLHKHNIDRSGRKKYVFGEDIGPTESTAIALDLEQKYPEFKKYAEDIKKFNHNNLENMKEAGLINQEAIDYMESMYPNYIPISRDVENSIYTGNNEKTGANTPIKKATGGNADIQPIKDAMAQQAIRLKRLVNQNNLGKELAKTLKNSKVEEGVDIEMTPSLLFDIETMVETDSEGNKYYTYFENGKQQKIKIDDNLYESLIPTEIGKWENTLPIKALQKVTSIHRSLLTSSNPLFVVTNFFKDFQDGMFNSKYSSKFIKNYGKALSEIVTKGKYYQSYMANGGMTNTYFDYNEGIKKKTNKFVEKIRSVNEIVEQLPRLSEFISTLEDGKSLNEALYNSAEITTNFKRGGDITKALNRNGVNFLNASIQGLDKQFRNIKGQNGIKGYVNLLAKATIMSIAPSILNHMLLDDDEDYQDLPQSTKDLYYLFKYDDDKFIRIPKGRVLSIFGAIARRTVESMQGQEDSWTGFKDTIINQVAPNNPLEDNILAPISQVKNNKTWYGTDLVSSRLQKELPKNQYDETTDELSKWLGSKLNISPKKINYLLDQYSGALGDILLPIITPQAKQNVIADKFTTDSVLKNKNVSTFYETLEKQTQIANDSFATDEDEIQLKYLNSISRSMSDLYKEKRQIQMSNISNKEKTKKVREIQEQINKLAEEGLNNYKNTTQGKSYSKVGNEEYYKNSSGEWTKLSAEEKEKMGDISIEVYSDYKQKLYKEKNKQVSKGVLKKTQDLKEKDKIQILLDSKYTDKQITQIYETYIRNQNEKEYATISKTGIDIKEYLKYKQQDFESNKKDDGTTKGKTVSGSKKKKVYEYVNNMNITYNQKLLLLGMQYSLKDSEKTKLANYINNLKITKDEKLEIYERVSGFKVYKNGTVKW